MQIDQALRRAAWRLRRRFGGAADNDPLVTVEGAPPGPPPRRSPSIGLWLLAAAGVALLAAGLLLRP